MMSYIYLILSSSPWTCKNTCPCKYFQYTIQKFETYILSFFLTKEAFNRVFITSAILIFKGGLKIMHTENEKPENKQSRMNNPYPPFPTPFSTPYRVRAIIGHFTFFCYKYNVLSFLQVPWSSYEYLLIVKDIYLMLILNENKQLKTFYHFFP